MAYTPPPSTVVPLVLGGVYTPPPSATVPLVLGDLAAIGFAWPSAEIVPVPPPLPPVPASARGRPFWAALINGQLHATERYCTTPSDRPANTFSDGRLEFPRFVRAYSNALLGGSPLPTEGISELVITRSQDGFNIDATRGDPVRLFYGLIDGTANNSWRTAPLSSLREYAGMTVDTLGSNGEKYTVQLRGALYALEQRFAPLFDPLGGYLAVRGRARPVCLGRVQFALPLFAQSINALDPDGYHVSPGDYQELVQLRQSGLTLATPADYTLTATGFELTALSTGPLQADMKGEKYAGAWAEDIDDALRYTLTTRAGITIDKIGGIDLPFEASLFVDNDTKCDDVAAQLLNACNAGLYYGLDGLIYAARLTEPSNTPDLVLHIDDCFTDSVLAETDTAPGLTGMILIAANPAVINQSEDLSGSLVSISTRRDAPIIRTITGFYALANEKPARSLAIYGGADGATIQDDAIDLYGAERHTVRVQAPTQLVAGLELLKTVFFTDRAQWVNGGRFRLLTVSHLDPVRAEITIWGGWAI